jgi:hypothetical protein
MKRVTNTWKEPIVLPLGVPGKPKERTVEQILVGQHIDVHEDQVSPEIKSMERKKKVSIEEAKVEEPKPAPPTKVTKPAAKKRTKKEPPTEKGLSEDEVKKLETELLQGEPDPTEG